MLCVRWAEAQQLLRMQRCDERGPSQRLSCEVVSKYTHLTWSIRCCAERLVLDWQPFRAPQVKRWTACPLCSATGEQTCSNCLGTGVVVPL